jgi:hypothetical protein
MGMTAVELKMLDLDGSGCSPLKYELHVRLQAGDFFGIVRPFVVMFIPIGIIPLNEPSRDLLAIPLRNENPGRFFSDLVCKGLHKALH